MLLYAVRLDGCCRKSYKVDTLDVSIEVRYGILLVVTESVNRIRGVERDHPPYQPTFEPSL